MENTTGQKSHSINYGPGQQRYFSLGISHSRSPGYTMCKKQKSQTKRKSGGFLSWLRKGIFFRIRERKLKMQLKDQQQSGRCEDCEMAMKARTLVACGEHREPPSRLCFFSRDPCNCYPVNSSPSAVLLVLRMTTRPASITSAPRWPCPLLVVMYMSSLESSGA